MSLQRLELVTSYINANFSQYTLLDLGCRTCDLSFLLSGCQKYVGTDLDSDAATIRCDLEKALPFDDRSYDLVCALDVLEHLENIHSAVEEMKRIAKSTIIISLPNMAHWSFRLNFLFKGNLSGKYKFHSKQVKDRHRWVTNYIESKDFLDVNFYGATLEFIDVIPKRGRTRLIIGPIEKILAKIFPNLFVYGLICVVNLNAIKKI